MKMKAYFSKIGYQVLQELMQKVLLNLTDKYLINNLLKY